MTEQHPITPPPELIEQWFQDWDWRDDGPPCNEAVAIRAARWGANQELEACCEWVSQWCPVVGDGPPELGLRAARRPQPQSLAEEALEELEELKTLHRDLYAQGLGYDFPATRRALERLQELEGQA